MSKIKVVILAGGFGTRLSEYTEEIPKPMVTIGGIPILIHIMGLYAKHHYNEFIVATGYKSDVISSYFFKNSKKTIKNTLLKKVFEFQPDQNDNKNVWKVTLIFTGIKTMTGGRIKKIKKEIKENYFMMTYGDGISNVNITKLVSMHLKSKKIATLTAVRPPVRFGELILNGNNVREFSEKPKIQKGWINGGFFVFKKTIFNFIDGDHIMLEREPLEKVVKQGQLQAYKHELFWQCMDTKRDKDILEDIWMNKKYIPWK
mgnify:FL=1|jgi:glucose-1-phosphate cytidylyltransferase